jgi:hypothetical protein
MDLEATAQSKFKDRFKYARLKKPAAATKAKAESKAKSKAPT